MKIIARYFLIFFTLAFFENCFAQSLKSQIDSVNLITSEFINSNLDSSLTIFSKNLSDARSIGYKYGEANALNKLSFIQYLKGNLDESTRDILGAIRIYESLKSYSDLAYLYGEYGYRLKQQDVKKAKYYMKLGIQIAEKNNFEDALAMLYDNYGVLKEMENELDSAAFFYKKSLDYKLSLNDTVGIPFSLNKLAGASAMKGDFKKALQYLNSSDEYRNKENGDYGRAENLVLRGEILQMQGKTDSSIAAFTNCLKLSIKLKNTNLTQYCYEQISNLYEQKKEYKKALESFKNHAAYKDTLLNIKTNERIAELQTAYETEKKDRLISDKDLEIKEKNNILVILISIAVLLIIISVWVYRSQKQKRERIKNELELKNKLTKANLENKIRSEMLRISRELHDNIGSQLTFMISSLDNLTYKLNSPGAAEKINILRNFGRETLSELRNTVWAIKQEEGDINKLILKINEIIQRFNNEIETIKIKLTNNIKNKIKLSSAQMLNIYRIIQEAIQNTIKHTDSSQIIIEFEETGDGFSLLIKDNGKGIDAENLYGGSGIQNMKDRCREASGVFEINSDSLGTKINCRFKVN